MGGKRLIITVILGAAVLVSNAQNIWHEPLSLPDSARYGIRLTGEGAVNSNALTNAFFFGFVNGRFVNDAEKDRMLERAKANNRFGIDGTYGIQADFKGKPGSKIIRHTVGLAERYHADGTLTKEAVELVLYGNKRFAGQEINLDDTRLRYLRWKEVSYGFTAQLSGGWQAGGTITGIVGDQNLNFSTDYARLYTSPTGEQMRLNGTFLLQQSDTAQPGPHAFNGMGFSLGGFVHKEWLARNAERGYLRFEVQDAGAIYWSTNSVQYPGDTLYVYNGTEIDRILDVQDADINPLTPDSIAELITPDAGTGSYHALLPATIQASIYQRFSTYDVQLGINHRFFASYSPFFFSRIRYRTGPWRLGGNLGLGGYGTWQTGLEAAYEGEQFCVSVGTRNVESLAFWQHMGGSSAFVRLAVFW